MGSITTWEPAAALQVFTANSDVDFKSKCLAEIELALSTLKDALAEIRTRERIFGTNMATIQNRQDFANNTIRTLNTGSDMLTLADMNEEGANMVSPQTSSQLAMTSLSMASQNAQQVMQLFR